MKWDLKDNRYGGVTYRNEWEGGNGEMGIARTVRVPRDSRDDGSGVGHIKKQFWGGGEGVKETVGLVLGWKVKQKTNQKKQHRDGGGIGQRDNRNVSRMGQTDNSWR